MEEERDKRIEERKKAEAKKKAEEEESVKLGIVEIKDDEPAEKEKEKEKEKEEEEEAAPLEQFPDQKLSDNGKQAPNSGNGGKTDKYYWVQNLADVDVYIAIPQGLSFVIVF